MTLVVLEVCDACLDGAGGECHAPGCAFWMSAAPDVPIRDRVIGGPIGEDTPIGRLFRSVKRRGGLPAT